VSVYGATNRVPAAAKKVMLEAIDSEATDDMQSVAYS
jgi:hypothetical protein